MSTVAIILVLAGTIGLVIFSRRSLLNLRAHGFSRFIAMEFLLVLILLNMPRWFEEPFCPRQIASWVLLFLSIPLALGGFVSLKRFGGAREDVQEGSNLRFENTTHLVTTGIYRIIRHPMYASLLVLGAGAYLKDVTLGASLLFAGIVLALTATAFTEERENIVRFGGEYEAYRRKTKMFIPFLF